jgi:SAM-dependent methyltransferase
MSKHGEIDYLRNLGEEGIRHAIHKPFSGSDCPRHLAQMAILFSVLPPPPGRLLDLGCGTGWTSTFFAKAGYEVVGVDICPDMIFHARQSRDHEGIDQLDFVECDYEGLRYRDEFDAVVFFDSLHHACDEALALRKAYEALRPGGVCVTSEPGEGHQDTSLAHEITRRFQVTEKDMPPERIVALGRQAGFRSARLYPHSEAIFPLLYGRGDECLAQQRVEKLALWKRLILWLTSWGLGVGSPIFPTRVAETYYLRQLAQSFRRAPRSGGVVVLVK